MTNDEMNRFIQEKIYKIDWTNSPYCPVCGWQMKKEGDYSGCFPGSCSVRPVPAMRADRPIDYLNNYNGLFEYLAYHKHMPFIITQNDGRYCSGVWRKNEGDATDNDSWHRSFHMLSPGEALVSATILAFGGTL